MGTHNDGQVSADTKAALKHERTAETESLDELRLHKLQKIFEAMMALEKE